MTLMIPDVKFSIGSSSTTAASSGGAGGVDVSLDDMIKNRRKDQMTKTRRGAAARKPSAVDRVQGRGRAKRAAAINARRGVASATSNKPSAMEMDREVHRQTRRSNRAKESSLRKATGGRVPKARTPKRTNSQNQNNATGKKKGGAKSELSQIPPTWVAGTRRPPSRKAVAAAANAMTEAGFKVPQGMQMVISFAPAPQNDPTVNPKKKTGNKGGNNNNANSRNNNSNRRGGRGGGRR